MVEYQPGTVQTYTMAFADPIPFLIADTESLQVNPDLLRLDILGELAASTPPHVSHLPRLLVHPSELLGSTPLAFADCPSIASF